MQIFHPKLQLKRVILHIPHGLLIGRVFWKGSVGTVSMAIACAAFILVYAYWFIKYEENEDKHTGDEAWNDEFGAITGLVLMYGAWEIWG